MKYVEWFMQWSCAVIAAAAAGLTGWALWDEYYFQAALFAANTASFGILFGAMRNLRALDGE